MRPMPLLLALSLVACGGNDKADTGASGTDTATDTGPLETDFPLSNADQVAEAFEMAMLPSGLFALTMVTSMGVDSGPDASGTSCPEVVVADTTTTITGACTADDGTAYTGAVVVAAAGSGLRVTYDNWGWGGDDMLNVDGTHAVGADLGVSTVEPGDGLRVTGRDGGRTVSVTFHSFDQLLPYGGMLFGMEPGNYPVQAAYTAVGLTGSGTATLEGSYTHTAACGTGPSNATFTLVGAQRVTLSVADCATNHCTHFEAEDGLAGDLCDEVSSGDTGVTASN